jgi:8-oxo-dGTP pyrophosphatase MutT (NUDIX family)
VSRFTDASLETLRDLLQRHPSIAIEAPQFRRACVLVPLVHDRGEWSIVFTRRSANLAAHSGQIAFPGGSVEEGEALEAAAVREAEEEVGISRASVDLIGRLDDVVTNSGFLVTPFVGVLREKIDYVIDEGEVTEVFEVPIEALLDIRQPEVRYVSFSDRQYPAYFYRYGDYEIWGLTGRMLKALVDLVWQAI